MDNFWGENFYNHPELTDEMLEVAEKKLGVKLPAEYVELLKQQNGGYTTNFVFPTDQENSWAEDHVPLNELFGIVTDEAVETAQNILDTEYMTEEWGLPERQVLLSGAGHWWITLDYRNGGEPTVRWLDVESDETFELASSFKAFMSRLVAESEFEQF
ncbi:SMI1/KNR4 family protein [Reinekea blandensis]|uniref:Knr4/Smi1-like domain-containing protein n=1 Tax=Reinekea blandensis MED297 TaxID=314283 RepID=A4BCB8_9GAMM|nr:SMI1/KNR4 family protein [Reinekea blandensis]EAR10184.1 hypothetical protein MED297_13212 [Reinekea sp. MED297] [Reinekea blandensis MED297]